MNLAKLCIIDEVVFLVDVYVSMSLIKLCFSLALSPRVVFLCTDFLQIHWFSIFNSFMMVIFLTGLVSMILMRTLRNDYAKYAREDDDLETLVMLS